MLLAVLLAAAVVVIVRSNGVEATQTELDDGAVWVTNQELGLVGRLNVKIDEIDTAVLGAPLGLDVVQDERHVFMSGASGGVQRIDVLTGGASGSNRVPLGNYQLAGGVGVVYDEETGALWTGPATQVVGNLYPEAPDARLEPGTKVIVTAATEQTPIAGVNDTAGRLPDRGRVMALTSQGWQEIPLGPDYRPVSAEMGQGYVAETTLLPPTTVPGAPAPTAAPPEVLEMPVQRAGVSPSEAVELTAVGGRPIVLDDEAMVVIDEAIQVAVESNTVRLQQVGGEDPAVFVATDRALIRIGLVGEPSTRVIARRDDGGVLGVPSQPVRVGRCVYAAWSSAEPLHARWCDGNDEVAPQPIPGAQPDVELVWRVNQSNVVLNSPGNGDSWADHDGALAFVGNWSDVEPDAQMEEISDSVGQSDVVVDRRCTDDDSSTPIAGDDVVGVRGRQSMIELLVNDDDLDCEPFRIESVTPSVGEFGALTVVDSGQRVLWTPSEAFVADEPAGFSFEYQLVDAAGHRSELAEVAVSVLDDTANNPPGLIKVTEERTREMVSAVEEGQAIKYDVLQDWYDPEGDALEVTGVKVVGGGDVTVDRNSVLTFAAYGAPPGVSTVEVTVSDGRATTTNEWAVTIAPRGAELAPEAQDDFITVAVGSTAVIAPLENDSDPNEDTLSLQPSWRSPDGLQVFVANDEVSIAPQQPGLYRLDYVANDGSSSGGGEASILVTAVDPETGNSAPVAVPDQVEIRAERVVDIDVTGNDVDIDGDVLSVVDVTAPDGIRASIVDRHLVQVEIPASPTSGESVDGDGVPDEFYLTYRIVDGREGERSGGEPSGNTALRSSGSLTVSVIPPTEDAPPVLESDRLIVRAGEVNSINVLANDQDPDADELIIDSVDGPRVAALEDAGQAVIWFDESHVYAYGVAAGEYSVAYTVLANGKRASSEVTVEVVAPADAEHPNQPPQVPHQLVRAVRGGTVRVKLPLAGVDPDGDPVELAGGLGATRLGGGSVVTVDPDDAGVLLYTADPRSTGFDEFSYTVRDRQGATALGKVDVVVVDDGGWAPQAHDDAMIVKPGRQVIVDALGNDTSPQDRALSFASPAFFSADGQPNSAPVNRGDVELLDPSNPDFQGLMKVAVPTDRSTLVERYRVSDGVSESSALVRITPDPQAPNLGPRVADDTVLLADLERVAVGAEVAVDVTANDFDVDNADRSDALTVTVPEFQDARVEDNMVVVTLRPQPHIVVYRATDEDGDSAVGLIQVPGASSNTPPELSEVGRDPTQRTIAADSEQPLNVLLADVVTDVDGDPVAFTGTAPRIAGGDARLEYDEAGFILTPPADRPVSYTVSVEIEVTDRPDLSPQERADPTCNCVSTLVVQSIVESGADIRVVTPGAVEVPQLDELVTYDLEPLTEFYGDGTLTYAIDSAPSGFDVSISDADLTITSTEPHPVGSEFTLSYTATSPEGTSVTNTVTITIEETNLAVPVVGQLGPFEAVLGEQLDLPNLVAAAYSPFSDDPLVLSDASVTGGEFSCSEDGDCTFLSDDQIGSMVVTYTLDDPLGRSVSGSFTIVVKGAPLAPAAPAIESVGDGEVTLSWAQPDLQGGALATYRVMVEQTGAVFEFGSTGGTVTGLQNDTVYTFVVQAVNEVGEGEWSPPSSGAAPDRAPDPPINADIVDYGDASLSLQWAPPSTSDQYSAIVSYEVKVTPGGQVFSIDDPTTTSITIGAGALGEPLTNGQMYTFRVRARNSAEQNNGWSEWSGPSGAEKPSRFPDPPTDVVAVNSGDGGQPKFTVGWNAPAFDGGREISHYKACATSAAGAQQCVTADANAGNQAIFGPVDRNTVWTVSVRAYNTDHNNNESEPSAAAEVRAVGNPDPPDLNDTHGFSHGISVAASPNNGSGCADAYVEYSLDGDNWQTSNVFSGLDNGTAYDVYARMRLGASCGTDGVTYVSAAAGPLVETPYGPHPVVQLTGERVKSGLFNEYIRWHLTISRVDDGYGGQLQLASVGDCPFWELPGPEALITRTHNGSKYLRINKKYRSCRVTLSMPGVWEDVYFEEFN